MDGRVVVVLGAGQNMGLAVAQAVHEAGATVVCVDLSEEHAAQAAAAFGVLGLCADVTDREQLAAVFARVADQLGPVTGVIDVVGMARWEPFLETTDEAWDRQFDICLRHVMLTLQSAPRVMPAGGSIAFVGSISGANAAPGCAAYGAAKAALASLVGSAAVEFARAGIRVNAVSPGLISTGRVRALLDADPSAEQRTAASIPMGRLGTCEEVANALLFLVSDQSSYVSGQMLAVDGALSRKLTFEPPV